MSAQKKSSPARAALYNGAASGASANQAAHAAAARWRRVEAELSPILGAGGVLALYRRSLYQLRDSHPCLQLPHEATRTAGDFEPLRSALANLSQADAATTHSALMQVFRDLLAGLIGSPLSERLLRPATDASLIGPAAQDTTP